MAPMPPSSVARMRQIFAGTEHTIALARKYKIKTAWGTDILFSAANATRQGLQIVKMSQWYSAAEASTMATATHGELLQRSGRRNPYPGKLGVVQEGTLADLLLVDGNPLADLQLIGDPAKNLLR